MEQFFAYKTKALLRLCWLSKSPFRHQKIVAVAVTFSGVKRQMSRFKSRACGYHGDAARNAAYKKRDNEFSSPRTGIERQGVVNHSTIAVFLPLAIVEWKETPRHRGGNWEATYGEKKEIVADRVVFLLSTAHGKTLLSLSVGRDPTGLP